jgi:hypothetical protein
MNSKELYKVNKLNDFYNEYEINKEELIKNKQFYFRFLCYSYIDFMKCIELPNIHINSDLEAVLIEYRCFPHLEFLIRNTILKLGEKWSHTIVCGNLNYEYMCEMCQNISPNIKIILTDYDNLLPSQYNQFLTSIEFWQLFSGKKILIYQEDTILFKNNIHDFLHWDYIGAPFPKNQNDTPNCVGNGGLSLRTRDVMIKVIESIKVKETIFESSTLQYMKNSNLNFPPEDIYFSKNIQDFNLGKVSDWNSAFEFSTESTVNYHSLGGHKFWIMDKNWKNRMKITFSYKDYSFHNDVRKYLKYILLNDSYDKTPNIPNAFDVDLFFCNYVNQINENYDLHNENHNKIIMEFVKNQGLKGKIYHPKQLKNIFPSMNIYSFFNKILVEYKFNIYDAKDFVNHYLYQLTYDEVFEKLIQNKYENLNPSIPLLLLVFIGNEMVGYNLIEKILTYQRIQPFNIGFCFNSRTIYNKFKPLIKKNFTYYSIYLSKELGTDITPTVLMYDDISRKYTFEHIIKLHTKTIQNQYEDLTNYLLNQSLDELIQKKHKYCNCIGHNNYYIYLNEDLYNKMLLHDTSSFLDTKKCFVGGTIFYSPNKVFKETIEFVKKTNFRSYFFNNLYENNSINQNYSPIHFIERVFGIVNH